MSHNSISRSLCKPLAVTTVWAVALTPLCYGLQADQLDLKLRLREGNTYRGTLETTTESITGASGNEQLTHLQIGMGLNYRVQSVTSSTGRMDVRMTYEWASMKMKAPGVAIDFDSRTTKGQVHPAALIFAALVGQGIDATLDPNGTVAEVRGIELLQRSLVERAAPSAGPMRQALEAATAQQFNTQAIRTMIEGTFILPDKPVSVGGSWRRKVPPAPGTQSQVENVYTLRQRSAGSATIGVTSDIAVQGTAGGFSGSLVGSQTGELVIDESTGWTTAAEFVQQVSGNSGGVPMRMKTTVKMSGR